MNNCTAEGCETCGLVDLMARTAVPDIVFTGNDAIVEALKKACVELHGRLGVKIHEWKTAHHGWVTGFVCNGQHYLGFAIYGEERARIFSTPLVTFNAPLFEIG